MENKQSNIQYSTPLFMVSDMQASLKFYVDGLGFKLLNSWTPHGKIEWCWLQREGGSIMLQEFWVTEGKPYLSGNKPGAGVSIWFLCKDSLSLYHEFIANGINAQEPFVGNRLWDITVTDPDGYYVHFESPTEVEEETRYSEWVKTQKV